MALASTAITQAGPRAGPDLEGRRRPPDPGGPCHPKWERSGRRSGYHRFWLAEHHSAGAYISSMDGPARLIAINFSWTLIYIYQAHIYAYIGSGDIGVSHIHYIYILFWMIHTFAIGRRLPLGRRHYVDITGLSMPPAHERRQRSCAGERALNQRSMERDDFEVTPF